jgi:hypothetical protein
MEFFENLLDENYDKLNLINFKDSDIEIQFQSKNLNSSKTCVGIIERFIETKILFGGIFVMENFKKSDIKIKYTKHKTLEFELNKKLAETKEIEIVEYSGLNFKLIYDLDGVSGSINSKNIENCINSSAVINLKLRLNIKFPLNSSVKVYGKYKFLSFKDVEILHVGNINLSEKSSIDLYCFISLSNNDKFRERYLSEILDFVLQFLTLYNDDDLTALEFKGKDLKRQVYGFIKPKGLALLMKSLIEMFKEHYFLLYYNIYGTKEVFRSSSIENCLKMFGQTILLTYDKVCIDAFCTLELIEEKVSHCLFSHDNLLPGTLKAHKFTALNIKKAANYNGIMEFFKTSNSIRSLYAGVKKINFYNESVRNYIPKELSKNIFSSFCLEKRLTNLYGRKDFSKVSINRNNCLIKKLKESVEKLRNNQGRKFNFRLEITTDPINSLFYHNMLIKNLENTQWLVKIKKEVAECLTKCLQKVLDILESHESQTFSLISKNIINVTSLSVFFLNGSLNKHFLTEGIVKTILSDLEFTSCLDFKYCFGYRPSEEQSYYILTKVLSRTSVLNNNIKEKMKELVSIYVIGSLEKALIKMIEYMTVEIKLITKYDLERINVDSYNHVKTELLQFKDFFMMYFSLPKHSKIKKALFNLMYKIILDKNKKKSFYIIEFLAKYFIDIRDLKILYVYRFVPSKSVIPLRLNFEEFKKNHLSESQKVAFIKRNILNLERVNSTNQKVTKLPISRSEKVMIKMCSSMVSDMNLKNLNLFKNTFFPFYIGYNIGRCKTITDKIKNLVINDKNKLDNQRFNIRNLDISHYVAFLNQNGIRITNIDSLYYIEEINSKRYARTQLFDNIRDYEILYESQNFFINNLKPDMIYYMSDSNFIKKYSNLEQYICKRVVVLANKKPIVNNNDGTGNGFEIKNNSSEESVLALTRRRQVRKGYKTKNANNNLLLKDMSAMCENDDSIEFKEVSNSSIEFKMELIKIAISEETSTTSKVFFLNREGKNFLSPLGESILKNIKKKLKRQRICLMKHIGEFLKIFNLNRKEFVSFIYDCEKLNLLRIINCKVLNIEIKI